jgi:DNA-binding NarL/FixJ family response regulator
LPILEQYLKMDGLLSFSGTLVKLPPEKLLDVLIVDDHEVFRYGLRDLVNAIDGFHVIAEASKYEEVQAKIEEIPIDLVLLDLHLPDVEGTDGVRQLRRDCPQSRVIIISATMDDQLLLEAVLAGVSGYLTKDTSALDIVKALKGFRRGELAMLPTVAAHVIELLVQKCHLLETEFSIQQRDEAKELNDSRSDIPDTLLTSPSLSSYTSLPALTPQEEKVYQLMLRGQSNKQIAAQLYISRFTVGKHVQNILHKFGVTNRTQAVSYTLFEGGNEL